MVWEDGGREAPSYPICPDAAPPVTVELPFRKLRCVRLKQRKRAKPIADFLQGQGVPEWRAWLLAGSGKGWWRMAGSPQAAEAMSLAWFREQGLITHTARYAQLNQ